MFTRLQPILMVSDLEREKQFYLTLGFQTAFETPDFAGLACGEAILIGLQKSEECHPEDFDQFCTWQIGTKSVRAVEKVCSESGLPVVDAVTEQPWGDWTLAVRTPNGYRVIFEGPE